MHLYAGQQWRIRRREQTYGHAGRGKKEKVNGNSVVGHLGLLPEMMSRRKTFFKSLDQGHSGERGGSKGHTQSGLVFGSYSEARSRQTPEGTVWLPD